VLFVTPWLEIGGAERIVLALVADSVNQRHATVVAAARGSLVQELPPDVGFVELQHGWGGRDWWRNVRRLVSTIRSTQPRAINVHSLASGAAVRVAVFLSGVRPRLVLTIHSTGGRPAKLPLVGLCGTVFFDRVITVSEQLQRQARRWSPPWRRQHVHVVRAGALVSDAQAVHGKTVAIVGRLVELKGHRLLLDAWSAVSSSSTAVGWRLEIWGAGPEHQTIAERVATSERLRETVVLRGPVANAAARLHEVDILVLPSLREGLPLVLLEAMAAGVPVLAADLPGCRELVGDSAGVLFPPGDVRALRESLIDLMRNPATRKALGRAGRERVRAQFSEDRMLAAYREAMQLDRRRVPAT
jgi:glycosyltransferase involved in cell wall biosynthesis